MARRNPLLKDAEEKTDEDTADKSVEKAGGGEIMIDALPTLTNIFNTITKSD